MSSNLPVSACFCFVMLCFFKSFKKYILIYPLNRYNSTRQTFIKALLLFSPKFQCRSMRVFCFLFLAALGLCCCAWAFSSCGERGLLFVVVCRLLIAVASLVAENGVQAHGLQQLWLAGSRAQAQQLWLTVLVAPRHVGSSRTRDGNCVPCIGRRILNHCTTSEVLVNERFISGFSNGCTQIIFIISLIIV